MTEYPKTITVGAISVVVATAEEEARWRPRVRVATPVVVEPVVSTYWPAAVVTRSTPKKRRT